MMMTSRNLRGPAWVVLSAALRPQPVGTDVVALAALVVVAACRRRLCCSVSRATPRPHPHPHPTPLPSRTSCAPEKARDLIFSRANEPIHCASICP
jgi:hypothetical protein